MNPCCVSFTSASTSGEIGKSLACQQIPDGATKGTWSCVHRGSTSAQCDTRCRFAAIDVSTLAGVGWDFVVGCSWDDMYCHWAACNTQLPNVCSVLCRFFHRLATACPYGGFIALPDWVMWYITLLMPWNDIGPSHITYIDTEPTRSNLYLKKKIMYGWFLLLYSCWTNT